MTTVEDSGAGAPGRGATPPVGTGAARSPSRAGGGDGAVHDQRRRRWSGMPIAVVIGLVPARTAAEDATAPSVVGAGPAPEADGAGTRGGDVGAHAPAAAVGAGAAGCPAGCPADDVDALHAQVIADMSRYAGRHQMSTLAVVADLLMIRDTLDSGVRSGADAAVRICRRELEVARSAVTAGVGRGGRRDVRLELAWHSIHRARALLPLVVPDDALEAQYLYASQRIGRVRPRDAELLSRLGSTVGDGGAVDDRGRQLLSYALSRAYSAADSRFRQVRKLRDRLLRTAWVMAAVTVVLVAVGALVPDAVPLCGGGGGVCPSGGSVPTGGDVATVAGFGVLGAALAGVLAVRRAQPTSSPYRLSPALAGLRAGLGGVLAVVGVMVVQAQVVPGLAGLDTVQQVAVYSVVFGFAQELVTRLLENRARSVQEAAAPPPSAGTPSWSADGELDGGTAAPRR